MPATPVSRPHVRLAELSERQLGVFTRAQSRECGVSGSALQHAVDAGRYAQIGHQVFRVVGVPLTWLGTVKAATLEGGAAAVAARSTALALHGLSPLQRKGRLAILVPYGLSVDKRLPALVHRTRTFVAEDRCEVAGIPTSTVTRALCDIGIDVGNRPAWRELVAEAIRNGMTDHAAMAGQLDRAGRIRSLGSMRRTLSLIDPDAQRTRSSAELAFARLLAVDGLPRPILNYEVVTPEGRLVAEIDAAYPQWRLGFEIDGFAWHSLPGQLEKDEVRALRLAELGWDIRRFPARTVTANPSWVATRVRRAIEQTTARLAVA